MSARLTRGDLLPRMLVNPPGPASRACSRGLHQYEAPGIQGAPPGESAIVWQQAAGSNVLDLDGNRYIDLTSGFGAAAVGHRNPEVVAAVRRQSGHLLHGLGDAHPHPLRLDLAARLAGLAPIREAQTYFAISGSDAVEIALKTALLATGKPGIVAFEPAYHGLTLGALNVTSRPAFRDPFTSHLHPHVHRLPFGCDPEAVVRLLSQHEEIGALIVEPIVGREGVLVPPTGWLSEVVAAARNVGVLTIADEILTGFGRTGAFFAIEHEGLEFDLLCCGKALGGGLPLAAVVGARSLMATWPAGGEALHTATFLANPLSCAAALAVLDLIEGQRLADRAASLGAELSDRFAGYPERFSSVTRVGGRGLLWGLEIESTRLARRFVRLLMQRGVLMLAGGPGGRVLELLPPLTIARRQLSFALEALEDTLGQAAA